MKIRILLASILVTLVSSAASHATSQTWDGFWDSTWNTSIANWTGSVWSSGDDAIFDSTGAGTVTIDTGGVSANSLTFNNTGYTIAGASLTLTGAADITANSNATISSVILGSAGLVKDGSGTLTLAGANTYSGATTINAGTLQAGAYYTFSANSAVTLANVAGATLALNGFHNTIGSLSGGGTTGGNVDFGAAPHGAWNDYTTLTVGGDNTSTTFAGSFTNNTWQTVFVKNGSGTLTMSGTNTSIGGATTINGGVFDISGIYQGPVTVNAGATLRMYGWGYDGDGLWSVGASAGNVVINGGTIEMANATGCYGSRNFTIGALGATLKASNTSGNWYFDNWASGAQTIQNDFSLTLTGVGKGEIKMVIAGTGSLTMNGAGTWQFDQANTYSGTTTVDAGTLKLSAAGSITASTGVNVGAGATFDTTSQSFAMLSTQTFKFTLNGTTGLVGKLVAGALDITTGVVDFATIGTLTADSYVIATYTSLTGSQFNSVLDLPTGYTLDYNYQGLNEIALVVPEPSTWAMLLGGLGMLTMFRRRRA
jgi:fibronectin-binding autotransporter adhesin